MDKNKFYQKYESFTLFTSPIKALLPVLILLISTLTPQTHATQAKLRQRREFTPKMGAAAAVYARNKARKTVTNNARPKRNTSKQTAQKRVVNRKKAPSKQNEKQMQADAQMARQLQAKKEHAARTEPKQRAPIKFMAAHTARARCENRWEQQKRNTRLGAQKRHANPPKQVMTPPHVSQFQHPPSRYDRYSCGAAAVQMALKMLHHQGILDATEIPTFWQLVDLLQIKKNKCAYSTDIANYLSNNLHLNCTLIHKPKRKIIDNLDTIISNSRITPTIALSHYGKKSSSSIGHFVLLWDTGDDDRFVALCDPSETNQKISYIPKDPFLQTCEAIIQITGKKY